MLQENIKIDIYGLHCPLTNQIKYVGQTRNIYTRFNSHCTGQTGDKVINWVRELKSQNTLPELVILETVYSAKEANQAETKWILFYRSTILNSKLSVGASPPEKEIRDFTDKRKILLLAAHWEKDIRTIQKWLEREDPMLEHPASKKIIEAKE